MNFKRPTLKIFVKAILYIHVYMCVISVCRPEFYLPFNGGRAVDMSGNKYYVGEELSYYGNGVAIFTGNDRLIVPRFTNIETKTLVIKVKYTSAPSSSARAIVSNSDCGNEPSIIIYEDNINIYFGVGTSESQMVYTSVQRLVRCLDQVTCSSYCIGKQLILRRKIASSQSHQSMHGLCT